ncbi:MAG TPA: hypothetical protein VFI30_03050 [Nocardioidaceae bacterium]|nr:hypothetical protein [Nocardioidaceae bacterium]
MNAEATHVVYSVMEQITTLAAAPLTRQAGPLRRLLSEAPVGGRQGRALDAARALTAAGVLLSASVHFDLYALEGFKQIAVVGPLFLLNAISGLVIALGVLLWRSWPPGLAAAGFGVATLAAFWWSVEVGLFGVHETPSGPAEVLAEVAEVAALVFGLATVLLAIPRGRRGTTRR